MGTIDHLFPSARKALLQVLFSRPEDSYYMRELVRAANKGHGVVQRELDNLVQSGLILREHIKGRTYFKANRESPIFSELQSIIRKTVGFEAILQQALEGLSGIELAFVFGSFATGEQKADSDVDLAVVGDCSFADVVEALAPAQEELARDINPVVYPVAEFRLKVASHNHFVSRLVDAEKIYVVGSARELERLVS